MASNSETHVANMALTALGKNNINSIDDANSPSAELLKSHIDQAIDEVLEMYHWPDARAKKALTPTGATVSIDWTYEHQLPSDYIAAKYINDQRYQYEIVGQAIQSHDSTVNLTYTKKITVGEMRSASLRKALAFVLARLVGPKLSADQDKIRQVNSDLKDLVAQAKVDNARKEQQGQHLGGSRFVDARLGRGTGSSRSGIYPDR